MLWICLSTIAQIVCTRIGHVIDGRVVEIQRLIWFMIWNQWALAIMSPFAHHQTTQTHGVGRCPWQALKNRGNMSTTYRKHSQRESRFISTHLTSVDNRGLQSMTKGQLANDYSATFPNAAYSIAPSNRRQFEGTVVPWWDGS